MLSYLLFIATVGGIYGLLALSLNLIWGGPASLLSAPTRRDCSRRPGRRRSFPAG
jgi:hypothetical protein